MNFNRAGGCKTARRRQIGSIGKGDGSGVVDVRPVYQNVDVTDRGTARAQAVTVLGKLAFLEGVVGLNRHTTGLDRTAADRDDRVRLVVHKRHGARTRGQCDAVTVSVVIVVLGLGRGQIKGRGLDVGVIRHLGRGAHVVFQHRHRARQADGTAARCGGINEQIIAVVRRHRHDVTLQGAASTGHNIGVGVAGVVVAAVVLVDRLLVKLDQSFTDGALHQQAAHRNRAKGTASAMGAQIRVLICKDGQTLAGGDHGRAGDVRLNDGVDVRERQVQLIGNLSGGRNSRRGGVPNTAVGIAFHRDIAARNGGVGNAGSNIRFNGVQHHADPERAAAGQANRDAGGHCGGT